MPGMRSRLVQTCRQALAAAFVLAVAAPAAGVGDLDIVVPADRGAAPVPGPGTGESGSLVASRPVRPRVRQVVVGGVDRRGAHALARSSGTRRSEVRRRLAAQTAPEPVTGLATVGVTWDPGQPRRQRGIRVLVRTLPAGGRWAAWENVDFDPREGAGPRSPEARQVRVGTSPMLVGHVAEVQVKVLTESGRAPRGLRLVLIDPGRTTAPKRQLPAIDTARLAAAGTSRTAGTRAVVTPKPKIFSRAQWGADETMRDPSSLRYGEVRAGFVHHTVNANDYTRAQVPAIIRGIYAYHTQALGWSDIGYNFLVDRFGRIWEGRFGGVDRPVVGAHTYGYNYVSFGAAGIGNFQVAPPTRAMIAAFARLFAWKLSLHGVDPADMHTWVKDRFLPAIDGHRDVYPTECPGRYLYRKLARIRTLAAQHQATFAGRRKSHDLSGSSWADVVARNKTTHELYEVRTGGQVGFAHAAAVGPRRPASDLVAAPGDINGDHLPDLLVRDGTGDTSLYPGNGAGGFGRAARSTRRFHGLDQISGVHDMTSDGHADVVGRSATTHALYLYPGTGRGGFRRARLLSPDWGRYDLTAGVGDLDGDGHNDLVARDGARLWLFPGTGHAGLGTRRLLPGRWRSFDLIAGAGDLTNDGVPDLVARRRRSKLTFVFPGDGHGGFAHPYGPFPTFKGVDFLAPDGRVTGSRWTDLVGRRPDGQLVVFANTGRRNLTRVVDTGTALDGADLVLDVGDWNGDGRGDVVSRSRRGTLWLHEGLPRARFAPAVRMARGFKTVRLLAAAGDLTGDGFPDLIGQPRGGKMRIYPGNGSTGIARSYPAHDAIAGTAQVGVGLWNADGAPDSIVRTRGGGLRLYSGNGPGGLTGGRQVGGGANRYDRLIGAGDVNGDGHPDVIARQHNDGTLWLLPGTRHGFGRRRFIGSGFGAFDLLG